MALRALEELTFYFRMQIERVLGSRALGKLRFRTYMYCGGGLNLQDLSGLGKAFLRM